MDEALIEFESRITGDYNSDMDIADEIARSNGISPEELIHQYFTKLN